MPDWQFDIRTVDRGKMFRLPADLSAMPAIHIAAMLFSGLTAVAIAFQLALAFGAPWGELTLGGKFPGRLPRSMRIVPVLSGLLLALSIEVVLARAGLAFASLQAASHFLIWIVTAYCALGAVANFITPSQRERALWLPVLLILLASSVVVGIG